VLQFGQNRLNIRTGQGPDGKPICDTFGLAVANYNHAKTKEELERRGLQPKEMSKTAWGIADPAGFPIEVGGRATT